MPILASARACPLIFLLGVSGCGEVVAQPIVEAELGQGGDGAAAAQGGAGPAVGGGGLAGLSSGGQGGSGGALIACDSVASWPSEWASFEVEAVRSINEARATGVTCAGSTGGPLAGLAEDAALRCAARSHARDMAERGYFSLGTWDDAAPTCGDDGDCAAGLTCDARWPNEGPMRCLPSATTWLESAGYSGSFVGQAIAMGQSSPASVIDSWLGSSDTCDLVMSARAEAIAVGYAESEAGDHLWTLILGG